MSSPTFEKERLKKLIIYIDRLSLTSEPSGQKADDKLN